MSVREERTEGRSDRATPPPRAVCERCDFAWYSAQMAEGLRLIGACPRCGGELRFAHDPETVDELHTPDRGTAPHMALGVPRPRPR